MGGNIPTFSLNFSRPGGEIVCQYYNFLRLGWGGYRKIQQACYDNAKAIADAVARMGPFEVIHGGDLNGLPAACWKLKDGVEAGFTLFDLADRLRMRGWLVPAYSMPPNRSDLVVQRVLVRHGFSQELGSLLIQDMYATLAHFRKHPVVNPMSEDEACCHEHSGRQRMVCHEHSGRHKVRT